jgi:hypothetical protein
MRSSELIAAGPHRGQRMATDDTTPRRSKAAPEGDLAVYPYSPVTIRVILVAHHPLRPQGLKIGNVRRETPVRSGGVTNVRQNSTGLHRAQAEFFFPHIKDRQVVTVEFQQDQSELVGLPNGAHLIHIWYHRFFNVWTRENV